MSNRDQAARTRGEARDRLTVVARFPATANQVLAWRKERSGSYGSALNVAICRHLNGAVSDRAIALAVQQLVDRHEIFRTRFAEDDDGILVQEVFDKAAVKLDVVDLRTLDADRREAERCRLGEVQASRPFDVTDDMSGCPFFRALLVRVSTDRAYLYLTFHTLVIDGWSLDLVGRELGTFAMLADQGKPSALEDVDLQFGDFASWQRDVAAAGALDPDRRFWKDELAGLPDFTLPPDRDDDGIGGSSRIRSTMIDRELSDRFESMARKNNLTMFSASCAAAARAMRGLSGRDEVVFGTHVAGRDDPASEAIVGPVSNVVVLRLPLGDRGYGETAKSVQDTVARAMAHATLPFAEIAGDRNVGAPLFRVSFTVQRTYISSASVEDRQYGSFRMESVPGPSVGAQCDLSLFMVGREAGWRLSCDYSPARYNEATIDRVLEAWLAEIAGAVAETSAPASQVALEASTQPAPDVPVPARSNPRIEALRSRIVCLQPHGDGTPVFALNISSVLYPVARAIGRENPFYDLHLCPSEIPIDLPPRHFTDHARDAVEMIRLARPTGPYILMGLCVSGALAVEAARILRSEGETVELVGLVDTYRPGFRERLGRFDRTLRRFQVLEMSTRKLLARWRAGELTFAQVLDNYRVMRTPIARMLLRPWLKQAAADAADALADNNRWFAECVLLPSQARFDMTPYDGPAVLFRSETAPTGRMFPRDFGWAGYTPSPLEVVIVPGTHDTIFRHEGAAVIGAFIKRVADKEQSRAVH